MNGCTANENLTLSDLAFQDLLLGTHNLRHRAIELSNLVLLVTIVEDKLQGLSLLEPVLHLHWREVNLGRISGRYHLGPPNFTPLLFLLGPFHDSKHNICTLRHLLASPKTDTQNDVLHKV